MAYSISNILIASRRVIIVRHTTTYTIIDERSSAIAKYRVGLRNAGVLRP
jgi:hypothetical protein